MSDDLETEDVRFFNIEEGDKILWGDRKVPLGVTEVYEIRNRTRVTAVSNRGDRIQTYPQHQSIVRFEQDRVLPSRSRNDLRRGLSARRGRVMPL